MMHLHLWSRTALGGLLVLLGLIIACNFWVIVHTQEGVLATSSRYLPKFMGLC